MPKVSIVVPAYNAQNFIIETLKSLSAQTFEDFEIIVINDGSSDKTDKLVLNYSRKDPRVKLFSQINKGPAAARNVGFKKAKGGYVIWADADDLWEKERLKILVNFLDKNKNYDLVTSDAYIWYPQKKEKSKRYYTVFKVPEKLDFGHLLLGNFIFTSTLMRRKIIENNLMDEDRAIMGTEDYEFWLRVIHAGNKLKIINKPLVWYRQIGSSLSAQTEKIPQTLLFVFGKIEKKLKLTLGQKKIINGRKNQLYYILGKIYLDKKNFKKAMSFFKKGTDSRNKLAIVLMKSPNFFFWLSSLKKNLKK